MNRVRCVVLDVDDTLYLERDNIKSGFDAVGRWASEHLGIEDFAERAWKHFLAGVRGTIFDVCLAESDVEARPELVRSLVERYRAHSPEIRLLRDVEECLRAFHGRRVLAAVTDRPRESQRAKVRALGLSRWLHPIVVTSELGESFGKPHPRGFELVQELTGHRGEECVYVADNARKDFVGPAALGWHTVHVRRPRGLYADHSGSDRVDRVVTDLSELATLLA